MKKYEKILNEMYDMNRNMISAAKQEKRIYKSLEKSMPFVPEEESSATSSPRKLLQRDIKRMALLRLEDSARTESDFKEVVRVWNRNDYTTGNGKNGITKLVSRMSLWNTVQIKTVWFFLFPKTERFGEVCRKGIFWMPFSTVLLKCMNWWKMKDCQKQSGN